MKCVITNHYFQQRSREIMRFLASICLSVRPPSIRSSALSHLNNHHYQSKVIVCVPVISGPFVVNRADAVDQLLISVLDFEARPR